MSVGGRWEVERVGKIWWVYSEVLGSVRNIGLDVRVVIWVSFERIKLSGKCKKLDDIYNIVLFM